MKKSQNKKLQPLVDVHTGVLTNQKGITLMALVTTIIVLLILAGISISMLTGNNGIINKAIEAKDSIEIATEKEIIQLSVTQIMMENQGNLIFDEETLRQVLENNSGLQGITAENSEGLLYIITFPDSKRQYELYSDGTIQDSVPKVNDETIGSIAQKDDDENVYLIQSIEDLVRIAKTVNEGTDTYKGKTFELVTNLNFFSKNSYRNPDGNEFGDINGDGITETTLIKELTSSTGFMPIGNYYYQFEGNIKGNGNTLYNLYINRENGQYVGLIGYLIAGSTIENIKLENCDITASSYASCLIGIIGTTISGSITNIKNCTISGNMQKAGYAGGLIGYYTSTSSTKGTLTIENCQNEVNINGGSNTGGIIGNVEYAEQVIIENCSNLGDVDSSSSYAGGVIGNLYNSDSNTITNCYNSGNIASKNGGNIGGIIGSVNHGVKTIIENCYNLGNVDSSSPYTGGIIGEFYYSDNNTITNCYNSGNITSSSTYIGGILGRATYITTITKCYNTGKIEGINNYQGGILGRVESGNKITIQQSYNTGIINGGGGIAGSGQNLFIDKCYNTGSIISDKMQSGGIVADILYGKVTNCYNTASIKSVRDYAGGIVCYGSNSEIENVYNLGDVTLDYNNCTAGGIGGNLYDSTVKNAYNFGQITSVGKPTSAMGYWSGTSTAENCYYLKETAEIGNSNTSSTIIITEVETLEELKTILNTNLTSIDCWQIGDNGYPVLIME